jgi:glycosyltransferase involved in cell wall biosynthesis
MKKVLFIVYYFPPMGGSGVQRPLKFVKYLRDFGWEPVVLCPEPGAYHTFDASLEEELQSLNVEVHRVEAKTPFHRAGQASREVSNIPDWLARLLRWISTFFWLPDNKTGWIKPGFRKAMQLIHDHKIDAVFATAAPYSNLIMAAMIKKASALPVVMDLRDDWLDSHLINYPTPFHRSRMASMEKKTLEQADVVTVINRDTRDALQGRLSGLNEIKILNQGFDPADFGASGLQKQDGNDSKCRILYSGLFYGQRKPDVFLEAVAEIAENNNRFRSAVQLEFQGGLDEASKALIRELGLDKHVVDYDYLDHEHAVANLRKADILWLIVGHTHKANQVTVGKMFEYFGSRRPILGLVPEGSSADLLRQYGAAFVADPYNKEAVKKQLEQLFRLWEEKKLPIPDEEFVKQYDRKVVSGELAAVLDSLMD